MAAPTTDKPPQGVSQIQDLRDGFNSFVAAGLVIATIVSIGSSWQVVPISTGLAALALLGLCLRSWLISSTLAGIVLSPVFPAVNGDVTTDVSNAIVAAITGAIVGWFLTLFTPKSSRPI